MTEDDACTVCKERPRVAGRHMCSKCVSKVVFEEILDDAPRPQHLESWS